MVGMHEASGITAAAGSSTAGLVPDPAASKRDTPGLKALPTAVVVVPPPDDPEPPTADTPTGTPLLQDRAVSQQATAVRRTADQQAFTSSTLDADILTWA